MEEFKEAQLCRSGVNAGDNIDAGNDDDDDDRDADDNVDEVVEDWMGWLELRNMNILLLLIYRKNKILNVIPSYCCSAKGLYMLHSATWLSANTT